VRGHIDADTLAAYREGLLSRRRAARVAAHLPGCPQCAATDAQLAGVTTILAASQAPPMPAGLAGRIEAALAAEAASRAAGEASRAAAAGAARGDGHRPLSGSPAGVGHDGGGVPARQPGGSRHRPPRRSWLTPRVAAVTAAVVVIAGGGYGVAQLLSQGTTTGGGSSAASGSSPARGAANSGARTGSAANRLAPSATTIRDLNVVRSGTNYQPQQLASQAKAVLGRYGQPQGTGKNHLPGSFGSTFANLPACMRRVSGGHTPQLVDLASYQGQRAAVIMLPTAQHQVRVVVVGTGCSGAASDVLDQTVVPGSG
jgi:putative zinc finger protein